MKTNVLSIDNLSVRYNTVEGVVHAVNNIDLNITKGRILGLVGETGAGKSSTALAVMGLLDKRNTSVTGDISFLDRNILSLSKNELLDIRGNKMAMIFQDPMTSLNPVFTVEKQIIEVLKNHTKLSKADMDKRVDQVLSMVGIDPRRKTDYPHQFSGGMKQRVVIAIALTQSPEFIIADEPTTALDVTIQLQVLELIKDLRSRLETSMLLITHDLGVVAEMCDDVAIMYAGHIVEKGNLQDIFTPEKPHHPYTIGLFNSVPDIEKKTKRLSPIAGLMPNPRSLPSGCPFHPRCPKRMDICATEFPEKYVDGEHEISCYLFKKEMS